MQIRLSSDRTIPGYLRIQEMFTYTADNPELCGTLQAKSNGGFSLNCIHPIRISRYVRRLTPLECERLQGFPDGWTDIGPWTDSKGKRHKESSDTARYTALGNNIALPFWLWLTERIAKYLPAGATLGSLFDGIGGFPLCWETVHGKGTALWASEIEEFPIAVTRRRVGKEDENANQELHHENRPLPRPDEAEIREDGGRTR